MKLLVSFLTVLLSTHLVASVSLTVNSQPDVCQSPECAILGAEIARSMNSSAEPCQDFYNFACGNFPNTIRYDPLKSTAWGGLDLLEDMMGLMSDHLQKRIFEMLVVDRVVDQSSDPEMAGLYNFTRQFFRQCNEWLGEQRYSLPDSELFKDFFRDIYRHLSQTMGESAEAASMESILAALVRAGGKGQVIVELPMSLRGNFFSSIDGSLANVSKASIYVDDYYTRNDMPINLDRLVPFFSQVGLGSGEFNLSKKAANFERTMGQLRGAISRQWNSNCTFDWQQLNYKLQELDQLSACYQPDNPFSWTLFFEELLQGPVDPNAYVEVRRPDSTILLVSFLKSQKIHVNPEATKKVYSDHVSFLIFDWLLSFSAFLPRDLQDSWVRMYKTKVRPIMEEPAVTVCMRWTKELLQPIVERMYQKAYHREDFGDVQRLIGLIQETSIQSVRRQPWITPSAKRAIVKKILSTKQSIGMDDLTTEQLLSFYNVTLQDFLESKPDRFGQDFGNSFGKLLSQALCAYGRKNFEIMSGSSPVTMFFIINPLFVNALNWQARNQIVFPMGILAAPVYHQSYPDYVNLGILGYIIGHEIGHSFDNMGHTIDTLGAYGHFWDNETEANYLERMECVRESYGKYRLYPDGPLLDSNSTLGNDIADIIGIKAAAGALKSLRLKQPAGSTMRTLPNLPRRFSPEQMLFIRAAQSWCIKAETEALDSTFGRLPTHSPHHLRILGIVQNSQEFAKAFKCKAGNPMNPVGKCTFW